MFSLKLVMMYYRYLDFDFNISTNSLKIMYKDVEQT